MLSVFMTVFGFFFKPGIIKSLIKNWKFFAVVLVLAGAAWNYYSLTQTRDKYTALVVTYDTLVLNKNNQNKEIKRLKDLSDKQAKILRASAIRAAVIKAQYNKQLAELINQKPPRDCKGVMNWMIDTKGDLKW